jgi:two-component sensor histidine kinase
MASLVRWGLSLISDDIQTFPTYYPAVLFAALIGGWQAGMLAAALGGVIGWWAFMRPYFAFLPLTTGQSISLAVFLIACITIVWGADHYCRLATRLEAEEDLRKLAVEELAHRLKNKIATIQAVISSRLRDNPQARDAVLRMLTSLSATDDLIMSTQGKGAFIKEILDAEVGPYDSSRISMQGPDVFLPTKLAMSIALVVHELATNAAKYGALAGPTGRLDIVWSVTAEEMMISWREGGGPAVSPSGHQGFGTRLLSRVLVPFGGKIERRFEPAGLICEMSANLRTAQTLSHTDPPRRLGSAEGAIH